ncbi:PepSY-associated TM helix domain-containing protein [Streptomyces sp. PR69]|uniref:PepSY-associated TM helix domain-containing protein n=1 Tax=Streptomyces sp. PR69 TaxID=2984950 RepID=UPI00226400AB|nr:PepSY domain-containing protein [Streptomyces sp. PR69]
MSIETPAKGTPAEGTGTTASDEAGPPAAASAPSAWSALRPLALRIHFYAGVLVAPLLLVAAVSGLLYALSFPAEKLIYRHELTVPAGERTLPLEEQVEAARAAHPEGTVTAVWPSYEDGATTRVLMASPEVEEDRSLAVFVNPYTAEIRGELPSYGGSGALPLRAWLDELHRDLHLGEPGRLYSEMAASWLWVVALGGVLLWLGRRRANKRAALIPERGASGRRRTLSWHGSVGLWAAAGLVILSVTGLTWSTYAGENIGMLRERLGGSTPRISATLDAGADAASSHGGHGGHGSSGGSGVGGGERPPSADNADIGIDRAVAAAKAAGIDTGGQIAISLPAEGNGYVVKETDTQFPVHRDSVALDPADGAVLDQLRFADYPLLAKLTTYGIAAHMGVLFGLPNQLALAALMVALIMLTVWGYRMWWQRRPAKERTLSMGRPVPRGAWRKAPVPLLLPLAAAVALTGWFVPLLGWSLLAFLALDAALGFAARRRAPGNRNPSRS